MASIPTDRSGEGNYPDRQNLPGGTDIGKLSKDLADLYVARATAQAEAAAAQSVATAKAKGAEIVAKGKLHQTVRDGHAADVEAAAAAAETQPDPSVAYPPLPTGGQPSELGLSQLAGFSPEDVSGGAGIQAATGGLGRADGSGGGPDYVAQARAAGPYTTHQETDSTTYAQYPTFVQPLPHHTTQDTTLPALTPFQSASLAIAQSKVEVSDSKNKLKVMDDLAKNIGWAQYLFETQPDTFTHKDLDKVIATQLQAASDMNIPQAAHSYIIGRGLGEAARIKGESGVKESTNRPEFLKLQAAIDKEVPGTQHYHELLGRLNKMSTESDWSRAQSNEFRLRMSTEYRNLSNRFGNASEGVVITDHINQLVEGNPALVGTAGKVGRFYTEFGGGLFDLFAAIKPAVKETMVASAQKSLEDLRAEHAEIPSEIEAYNRIASKFYDPKGHGQIQQYMFALATVLSTASTERPSIRGIEVFMSQNLDAYKIGSKEQFQAELGTIRDRLGNYKHNLGEDFKMLPAPFNAPPDYKFEFRQAAVPNQIPAAPTPSGPTPLSTSPNELPGVPKR